MTFDARAAARRLAKAWKDQTLIDALPEGERPSTLDEAYDIQALLQQEVEEPGGHSRGWKIGGATVAGLRASPSGKAVVGFLREACVHPSGAVLPMPATGGIVFEVEIAVRFARDIDPASEAFDASMIDAAFLAFEVVRSRFQDRKAVGQPSFVADAAGFHAFVLGDELPGALQSTSFAAPASLRGNGAVIAGPMTGDERTEVPVALSHFWEHAVSRGLRIPAGAFLTTGTQTRPVEVKEAGTYEGSLDGKGVWVTFK